jgi:hypothetical protein
MSTDQTAEQIIADALDPTSWQASPPYLATAARIAGRLRAAGLLPGPGDIVVSREAHRFAVEVLEGASQHTDCDDCWYSCSTLTCDESRASTICDCGADKAAAALAALSQPHPAQEQQ